MMKSMRLIVPPALVVAAALSAGAGTAAAQSPDDAAALRRMLAVQPDHVATVTLVMYARDHAFGGKSKVARSGKRRVEVNGSTVFITEAGKPTVKVYHDRREYAELPPEEEAKYPLGAEAIAARDDARFKLSGREKVGEYDALKIEAAYPVSKQIELRAVFYVAPGLKNLVVKEEYYEGENPIVMSFLEGVSLEVPGELFVMPEGYKKVIEKAPPDDPAGELSKGSGKPSAEKARPPKPRRD